MLMLGARFALVMLALMVSLPFLVTLHTTPIPSFHAEWLAGLLGLLAGVGLIGARRLPLPGVTLLALALAGLAAAQSASGHAPVPQLATLFALYLLWAALLGATASHLATVLGHARLARTLASAILIGALFVALLALVRPWLAVLVWPGFSLRQGGALGQVNHLTIYLWLGLACALYLRTCARLSRGAFWAVALLLTGTATLAGQRSSFLYVFALAAVAIWQARQSAGQPDGRRLAFGIGLLFVAWQPVALLLPSLGGGTGDAKPPPALRVVQAVGGPSERMKLLRMGVAGMVDAPLRGHGIGSYPGLSLTLADDIRPADNPGPGEHAHNLFVQLGAELGLPAALLVALAAGAWLWRLPRRAAAAETAWAAAVVVMLGAYSMIEYPLWYSFFLGPLAIVAGAFGGDHGRGGRLAPVALTLGLLALGMLALTDLRRDYLGIERAIALGTRPADLPEAKAALLSVPQTSLLAPWIATTACMSLDPRSVGVDDGLAVCRVAVAFSTQHQCGANLAVLLWRAGEDAAARDLLRRLKRSARHDPAELDDLLPGPLPSRAPGSGPTSHPRVGGPLDAWLKGGPRP